MSHEKKLDEEVDRYTGGDQVIIERDKNK